ncbi:hypothetical protein EON83_01810 [bacterium]|nr:MAG: hypothetical protein EON83_01810 [bacterium]
MTFFEQLKERVKQTLTRFAARKTQEQAEGMAEEARDIVASTQALARRNPAGLAAIVGIGAVLVCLVASRRNVQTAQ